MPRAKRGFKRRRRIKKLKSQMSGMSTSGGQVRRGYEQVDRKFIYAYRDRRVKKRDFRALWISRLAAALGPNDLSYSRFIGAMKKAQVALDRKVLSDIAIMDPHGFKAIVDQVRAHAPAM
jgi:large subunit ribosomal protein L20